MAAFRYKRRKQFSELTSLSGLKDQIINIITPSRNSIKRRKSDPADGEQQTSKCPLKSWAATPANDSEYDTTTWVFKDVVTVIIMFYSPIRGEIQIKWTKVIGRYIALQMFDLQLYVKLCIKKDWKDFRNASYLKLTAWCKRWLWIQASAQIPPNSGSVHWREFLKSTEVDTG